MKKINASVVIPSYRADTSNIRRLILTIDLFLYQGFEVVVADNSGSLEKHQKLRAEFDNTIVYADTEANCNGTANFLAGFAAASGEYILFATDDDTYLPIGIQTLANTIANSAGYAGFCAPTVRYSFNETQIVNPPDLTGTSSIERLTQWIFCNIAVSFYGCYSRKIWQRYFRFIHQHPVKLAHHDQLLRFLVADAGNIACLNTAWFAYDASNWSSGQSSYESFVRHYKNAGFDERMVFMNSLLEGLEGVLCQLTLDNLAGREFQGAAVGYWWSGCIDSFRQVIEMNRHAISPALSQQIAPLLNYLNSTNDYSVYYLLQLFNDFLRDVYGDDFGLQDFWLHHATESLRI